MDSVQLAELQYQKKYRTKTENRFTWSLRSTPRLSDRLTNIIVYFARLEET